MPTAREIRVPLSVLFKPKRRVYLLVFSDFGLIVSYAGDRTELTGLWYSGGVIFEPRDFDRYRLTEDQQRFVDAMLMAARGITEPARRLA